MKKFKDFQAAFSYLCSITNYEKEPDFFSGLLRPVFDLRAIHRLLNHVGNPHKEGRFIHITGTKGKGSTALLVTALLRGMGFTVGTYTSPHLVDLTERIAINNEPIPRKSLVEHLNMLYPALEEAASDSDRPNPTFFEVLTALAFIHFHKGRTDFSVMEVGLGGRLDSTNVLLPHVAVITNIGLDHTKVLGERLEDIAWEKAGIVKEGIPLVTAEPSDTPAYRVIEEVCKERKAPLLRVGEEIRIDTQEVKKEGAQPGLHFSLVSQVRQYPSLFLPFFGRKQIRNVAAAILALEVLEEGGSIALSADGIRETLSSFHLPGRTEVISEQPRFVVDGAHNPLAIGNLMDTLEESFTYRRLIVIFAAAKDKDLEGMMKAIVPQAHVIIFSRTNSVRTATWKEYGELREKDPALWEGREVLDEPDFKKAVHRAFQIAGKEDLITATGSFYLVGDIIAWKGQAQPAQWPGSGEPA